MKRIAKITVALLLAVAMCFSLAGCYDEDLNWSAKYDDTELPAGAYIYYLSIAYNEAASKVSTEDEVLKSEIDGTPAETWIKNRADEYVNQYFYIQNEMKRLGLEMTDEDYSTCLQTTESYWNYFGTSFEKFGIAKTSFDIAYSQYNRMYLKSPATSRSASTRCTARAAKTKCRKASCASTLRTITTTTSISLRR